MTHVASSSIQDRNKNSAMLEFIKTATAFRQSRANFRLNFIDHNETITYPELYAKSVSFANWILEENFQHKKVAIIGRLNLFANVACIAKGLKYLI